MQTSVVPVVVTSVSMSSCGLCPVVLQGLGLLVPPSLLFILFLACFFARIALLLSLEAPHHAPSSHPLLCLSMSTPHWWLPIKRTKKTKIRRKPKMARRVHFVLCVHSLEHGQILSGLAYKLNWVLPLLRPLQESLIGVGGATLWYLHCTSFYCWVFCFNLKLKLIEQFFLTSLLNFWGIHIMYPYSVHLLVPTLLRLLFSSFLSRL